MKHRTVRRAAATEVMPLNESCKAAPLARSDNVHSLLLAKDIHQDLVSRVWAPFTLDAHFAEDSNWRNIGLLEMPIHRLGHAFGLNEFDESKLHRVVAIFLGCLLLNDDARPRLHDGHRNNGSIVLDQLGHSDFLTNESVNHMSPDYFACSLPNALISTSTTAGRPSFI